ncbi:MAG: GNAT family N-acetyltransferase [Desulfomonile tiedjei]|uniref:GNAT family N-acetyltransferase n=1 Tax=Desulfomonile tiedjei TaxID=2358 RepID=A0A9D6Z8F1_9BACT|nr:GNAT family N-acetyltransferase [Desulfomonile tiedjei]
MSSEKYAEFLAGIGHRVVRTKDTWWYESSSHVYSNFPYHIPVTVKLNEIDEVLGNTGFAAKYACPIEIGRPSYQHVCTERDYDFATLNQKARNRTRRGLERCSVRRLTFKELAATESLELCRDTWMRHGKPVPSDFEDYWSRFYNAADAASVLETWGAFVGDELGAFLIAVLTDGCMCLRDVCSHSNHLHAHPNNALVYLFTKDAIARQEVSEVSYGLQSLQEGTETLDRFKEGMGFPRRPVGQRIEVNRTLRPILRGPIAKAALRLSRMGNKNQTIRKLSGLLQWYTEQPNLSSSRNGNSRHR